MTAALERVRVSQTLAGSSAFAAAVSRQVARKLAARLDQVGLDAVRRCDAIVAAELVNDRPANRRRGGRHLLGSFRHEVIWNGSTFPVSIRLFSLASPVKVNAMESGADPHPISAINGPTLVFPGFNAKSGKGLARRRSSASWGTPSSPALVAHHRSVRRTATLACWRDRRRWTTLATCRTR